MKNIILALALGFITFNSNSAEFTHLGKVSKIYSLGSHLQYEDGVFIEGFTSAGTCFSNERGVLIRLKDDKRGDRQLSILMAAKFAGKNVEVRVNDDNKDQWGGCYMHILALVD